MKRRRKRKRPNIAYFRYMVTGGLPHGYQSEISSPGEIVSLDLLSDDTIQIVVELDMKRLDESGKLGLQRTVVLTLPAHHLTNIL